MAAGLPLELDEVPGGVVVADETGQVVAVNAVSMGEASKQARDIANTVTDSGGTLGGKYYRVVVKCHEGAGRESEVEFLFRYGL